MMNLEKQLKKPEVVLSELGLKLRLIQLEYPNLVTAAELADKITEEFEVDCNAQLVEDYWRLHIHFGDVEKQSREVEYGISY